MSVREEVMEFREGMMEFREEVMEFREEVMEFREGVATEGHPYSSFHNLGSSCRGGPPWPPLRGLLVRSRGLLVRSQ